jgi:hypothetical protein
VNECSFDRLMSLDLKHLSVHFNELKKQNNVSLIVILALKRVWEIISAYLICLRNCKTDKLLDSLQCIVYQICAGLATEHLPFS